MWKKIKPYVISLAISLGTGGLSALATRKSMDIYKIIKKPPLAPPSIAFPIAWTILFALMGISSAIVFVNRNKNKEDTGKALKIYGGSLIVNFLWSIIFFNLKAFPAAFLWLLFLWGLILATIIRYRKISKTASFLQIPYLLWVTFAGYLNAAIALMNK